MYVSMVNCAASCLTCVTVARKVFFSHGFDVEFILRFFDSLCECFYLLRLQDKRLKLLKFEIIFN